MFRNRLRALLALLCVAPLAGAAGASADAAEPACEDADLVPASDNLASAAASVVCLINAVRSERGEPALDTSGELRQAAQGMSDAMVQQSYFSHEAPDGTTLADRVRPTGYLPGGDRWVLGENLAWGPDSLATPRSIVNGWMSSDEHRANIVAADYEDIGVGITLGSPRADQKGGATYTADFGTRDTRPSVTVPTRLRTDVTDAAYIGLAYPAACSRACTLAARLYRHDEASGRRVLLATGRLALRFGGSGTVLVHPRPSAMRRSLGRLAGASLALVTEAVGTPVARTTRVSVRRR